MNIQNLIEDIISLPVEERIILSEIIQKSLCNVDLDSEKKWIELAMKRKNEILRGEASLILKEDVFEKIRKRFNK